MHLTRFVSGFSKLMIGRFVDLEFDKESGALKKTKFVSETEVISQQLASFGLSKSEKTQSEFSLGSSAPSQTVAKL